MAEATPRQQSPTVAQQAPSLVSELQKVRNQSRKLARAARRRMCVGVFGPSQAGKSYLVSILASRDGRPLQARFADKTYDFLREINPPGNRESTGLVTRFGLGLSDGSADFPVRVRLLTQTDIVKILGNSFLLDFDHQKAEFDGPDGAAIRKRLSELRAKAHPTPVGDLDSDDVLDLIEYFDTFFAGVTAELRTDYWREAIELAPRLSGHDRARLWSVLWYDFQPFTDLYLTLYDGLQKLGHRARGAARHGRADPARKEHRRRADARSAGRRFRRSAAGAAQAGRRPHVARRAICRARWSARSPPS